MHQEFEQMLFFCFFNQVSSAVNKSFEQVAMAKTTTPSPRLIYVIYLYNMIYITWSYNSISQNKWKAIFNFIRYCLNWKCKMYVQTVILYPQQWFILHGSGLFQSHYCVAVFCINHTNIFSKCTSIRIPMLESYTPWSNAITN